jgi:hypothetical protein
MLAKISLPIDIKRRALTIPRGLETFSLLVQVLTRVLFRPPIPQLAAMEQKYTARSKILV